MPIKMIDILTGPCGLPNTRELRARAGIISKICSEKISTGHPGIGPNGLANWRDEHVPELIKIIESLDNSELDDLQKVPYCSVCLTNHPGEC